MEEKIEKDLANFSLDAAPGDEKRTQKKGVAINKKMLIDASQAEEIHEI